jgi:hypothetical protein
MTALIPIFTATRWAGFRTSGRNRPANIGCDLSDGGGEVEVVVKLNGGAEYGDHGPVCETVAALLAVDLGLPVADPCLVEIQPEFVATIPDSAARTRVQGAVGINFGTRSLAPGWSSIPGGKTLPQIALPTMAEILAFDAIIQNPDRRVDRPNCLFQGGDIRIFDHDLAFSFLFSISGYPDPTQSETYEFLRHHVFFRQLKRAKLSFDRIVGAFGALPPQRFRAYCEVLPDTWPGKVLYADRIRTHLERVRVDFPRISTILTALLAS